MAWCFPVNHTMQFAGRKLHLRRPNPASKPTLEGFWRVICRYLELCSYALQSYCTRIAAAIVNERRGVCEIALNPQKLYYLKFQWWRMLQSRTQGKEWFPFKGDGRRGHLWQHKGQQGVGCLQTLPIPRCSDFSNWTLGRQPLPLSTTFYLGAAHQTAPPWQLARSCLPNLIQ